MINFQKFFNTNTIGGVFGPPIDPLYSDSLLKSSRIIKKLFNNHYWYGALSTFRLEANEKLVVSGGLDFRSYLGEHYAEVHDLLGGDYFVDSDDLNDSEPMHTVGDTIDYHNDAFVRWAGAFVLAGTKRYLYNCFLNLSSVYQGYNEVDYFKEGYEESGWKWIPGYTVKAGGNANVDEWTNVFMNVGYLSRTPVFQNVIDNSNSFVSKYSE